MIKAFKRIRLNLLAKNSIIKYFAYALGEIILVVIGILIALALNNWNENQKAKIIEIELYKEIKEDLKISLIDLEQGLENHYIDNDHTIKLRDHIKFKLPLDKDVVRNVLNIDNDDQFFPRTSGFEALKSIGFKSLQNDTLRESITNLYQLGFDRIVGMGRDKAPVRNFEFLTPLKNRYLNLSDSTYYRKINNADSLLLYGYKIINYPQFINDQSFLLQLQEGLSIRRFKIVNYIRMISWTKRLIAEIDDELERLENN